MEGVAAAASFATLIEVSVKILQYSAAVRGAKDDIRRFHQSLQALRDALERAKQLLDRPDAATSLPASGQVFDALEACQPQLEDLLEKLQKKLPKPDSRTGRIAGSIGISSLRWPFQSKDIESHVQRFESWKTTINLALQTDQTSVVLDISQKIDLSKLPSADAAVFDSHVDEHEARCLPGTRTDLLQGVSDWAASPESKLIYWLHGMAGTGKSTVSRTVAQDFADKGMLAASFFFKGGEAPRGDATRFFTTIAVQLASSFPVVVPHIKSALDSDPDISKRTMAQQFEKLILHPLGEAKAGLPTSIGVIVVDALDECEREQDIRMILRLLARAKELQHLTLRFFITSRPERSPRLGFKAMSGGAHEDLVLEDVAPLTIEHDISIFFEHEFSKIREEYNVSQDPPLPEDWPGPQNVQTLVKTAVPLFISAATMCLFIRDPRFDPSDRLQKVLTHQTSSHASKFDKTYLPVLDQLLSGLTESEKESLLTDFKQVVGSIIVFAQPLSKTSIANLLGITENTVHRVLDWLHSVLSIPNNRDFPVRLLHLSFRDFLVDPDKRGTNPFWIDEKQQHRVIASKCLDLLSGPDCLTTNICGLRSRDILALREGMVCVLTFSGDDRYLAVASQLDIYLFDMATETGCHINTDREYVGGALVFSADSRYLLSVNAAKARLSLWDISTQQRVQMIQGMGNNFGGPLMALGGDVSCIETPFGILRVPFYPAPAPKLQCPLKLFYLDGWIIRDGEKLLRIPQEYRIWSDSDTGSSFGGNTFSWINRHRRLTVLEIECE